MSTVAEAPFPAIVRRPSASTREGGPAPMEVLRLEYDETDRGAPIWTFTVTKVRSWWREEVEAAGFVVRSTYPVNAKRIKVMVRPEGQR